MRSPFKFLDPFTLADKQYFFGRQKETRQLYRQVLRTRLLLLYGLSGTGKTSLIQCGLAGEFDGPDWLPLWIRHQTDINESLQVAIKRLLPTTEGSVAEQIRQLYQHFLRPVYLIFDQFEEIFILGTNTERAEFVTTLKVILEEELPCTVLLVIREEYLGQLYPFEKAIPGLFDFRLRVERMDNANVKIVLRDSFKKFNISVEVSDEKHKEARLDEIIQNVSRERSGIELPYLQVYLDQLYREDYDRTYPNQPLLEEKSWPPIEFTADEIEKFGTIDKVLDRFMGEQIQLIQEKLIAHDPDTPSDTVKLVLDGFVSDEGTKRPVRYTRVGSKGMIRIEPTQQEFFPALSDDSLTICLQELERAKILRSEYDIIEIAHDSLAQIIDQKRTDEQRERNNIKRQIRLAADMFPKTGEYLTRKQITKFDDVLPQLTPDETTFFLKSKQVREEEENADLEEEKRRSAELEKALDDTKAAKKEADEQAKIAQTNEATAKRSATLASRWLVVAIIGLVGAIIGVFYAVKNQKEAKAAQQTAVKAQQTAENNLRQFQKSEFNAYLLDADTFLKSGDTTEIKTALNSAKNILNKFFSKKSTEFDLMQNDIKIREDKLKRK